MGVEAGEPAAVAGGNNEPLGMIQAATKTSSDAKPTLDLKAKINGVRIDGVKIVEKETADWNMKSLGSRMAVDAACAATAGGMVAPLITMIDK